MAFTLYNVGLENVKTYNPSDFSKCKVSYEGNAFGKRQTREWFITPAQVVILSDLAEIFDGRELTVAETIIMKDCPHDLYTCGLRGPSKNIHLNEISETAKYDLIG